MRRIRDERHHVGHHRHAQAVPVRQHHGHRIAVLEGDVHIVGVREAHLDLASHHQIANRGVAVDEAHLVRLESSKQLVCLCVAEQNVERGNMERRRAEARVSDGDLALPLRIGQIEDRAWRFVLCDQLGVVGNHADPRRKAGPISVRIDERRRYADGARRPVRCQHVARLQHERANGLVRPEHIRLRTVLLREEPVCQPRRFRFLGVVRDADPDAGPPLVLAQHGLGKDTIGRDVDRHRTLGGPSRLW